MTTPLLDDMTLLGQTAVVTGASSGIGAATAAALARAGANVVYAVRDVEKGRKAASAVSRPADVRQLDLASLESVRSFAANWDGPIDLLINNAGVSSKTRQETRDGFELQIGTNHLGHFALTNLLLPHVRGRVVSLASQAERMARLDLDDFNSERGEYRSQRVYNNTKLANLLFIAELQRKLQAAGSPVKAMAAHPGFVNSGMTGEVTGAVARFMVRTMAQAPEDGALPVLYAATAEMPGGSFTGPERWMHMRGGAELIKRSKTAADAELAARLWALSERLTSTRFPNPLNSPESARRGR